VYMHRIELDTLTLIVCAALGIDRCSGPHYLLSRCAEVVYGRRVSLSKLEIDRVVDCECSSCKLQVNNLHKERFK
jgi:hypothetical protein